MDCCLFVYLHIGSVDLARVMLTTDTERLLVKIKALQEH